MKQTHFQSGFVEFSGSSNNSFVDFRLIGLYVLSFPKNEFINLHILF